jgi:hypothetical protein
MRTDIQGELILCHINSVEVQNLQSVGGQNSDLILCRILILLFPGLCGGSGHLLHWVKNTKNGIVTAVLVTGFRV